MPLFWNRDSLYQVVCQLRTAAGDKVHTGTGIFLTKGPREIFLLTAEHVARHCSPQTVVVIATPTGEPYGIPLVQLASPFFRKHPLADLAVTRLRPSPPTLELLQNRTFPLEQIHLGEEHVGRDDELTTIGFPQGLGVQGPRFMPLTFRSYAASPSLSYPRGDTQQVNDFLVLENPALTGYSGGPVFDLGVVRAGNMVSTKYSTVLHGIIHGSIIDQCGALGMVTPTKYLANWL